MSDRPRSIPLVASSVGNAPNVTTPSLTQDDVMDILAAFHDSGFAHLELTLGSIRVAVNRASASSASRVGLPVTTEDVVAPLLGMFQAGPEPDAAAFVRLGTLVQPDTTIGMIRVMQNLTAVNAGVRGTVVDVLVQDGQLVEFGQSLLRISPHRAAPEIGDQESKQPSAR